jgi:20S proteasome subunit alpha 7
MIAKRVAGYVTAFTLYSSVRPFGLNSLIGAVDVHGPALYMVEPSGLYYVLHFNTGIQCMCSRKRISGC